MGYLINNVIEKIEVTIPQVDIAPLRTIPYQIIDKNKLTNYTILAANLTTQGNVISFGHFYLQYGYALTPNKIAIYDENVSPISGRQSNFIINMMHPPNVFGSISDFAEDLTILTDNTPSGTDDLICTVYYIRNF